MFWLRIVVVFGLLVLTGFSLFPILHSGVIRGGYSKSIARRDRPWAYWSFVALFTACMGLVVAAADKALR